MEFLEPGKPGIAEKRGRVGLAVTAELLGLERAVDCEWSLVGSSAARLVRAPVRPVILEYLDGRQQPTSTSIDTAATATAGWLGHSLTTLIQTHISEELFNLLPVTQVSIVA